VRENAERKGRRYLSEGRLTIERVDVAGIRATRRGAGALYSLSYQNGAWRCSWPAAGRCAHLIALMLVCVREAGP
jgi:hypothetical protein